jgi:hypothetical protein
MARITREAAITREARVKKQHPPQSGFLIRVQVIRWVTYLGKWCQGWVQVTESFLGGCRRFWHSFCLGGFFELLELRYITRDHHPQSSEGE